MCSDIIIFYNQHCVFEIFFLGMTMRNKTAFCIKAWSSCPTVMSWLTCMSHGPFPMPSAQLLVSKTKSLFIFVLNHYDGVARLSSLLQGEQEGATGPVFTPLFVVATLRSLSFAKKAINLGNFKSLLPDSLSRKCVLWRTSLICE